MLNIRLVWLLMTRKDALMTCLIPHNASILLVMGQIDCIAKNMPRNLEANHAKIN